MSAHIDLQDQVLRKLAYLREHPDTDIIAPCRCAAPLFHQTRLFWQSGRPGAPGLGLRSGTAAARAESPREQPAQCGPGRFVRQDSGVGQVLGGFTRVWRTAAVPIGRRPMYQAGSLAAPNG